MFVTFERNKKYLISMASELKDIDQKAQGKCQELEATMTENMKTMTSSIQQELETTMTENMKTMTSSIQQELETTMTENMKTMSSSIQQELEATMTENMKTMSSSIQQELEATMAQNLKTTTSAIQKQPEATMTENMKTMIENTKTTTSAIQELQSTYGSLERTLATQTSTLRYLFVRFDVSDQFKGKRYLVSKAMDLNVVDADASCVEYGGYLTEPVCVRLCYGLCEKSGSRYFLLRRR